MDREIKIGDLFEVDEIKGSTIRVVHSLTQGNDPEGTTFGSWCVQQVDGVWKMYGYGGTMLPELISRWLPEQQRLSALEFARAMRGRGFTPEMRRRSLAEYNSSRVLPQ